MITQFIREHDDDSYIVEIPDGDEIQCECEKIILKDDSVECDFCQHLYCHGCGVKDYKNTGWFICNNCLSEAELIIDVLIDTPTT